MAGKRKLFIAHAQELAHRLVHTIEHGGLVEQFVRSYAERYNRRKLSDPLRLHELESTIGREALLTIAVEVRHLAPRAFAAGHSAPGQEEMILGETFFSEFVASVIRSLEWPVADVPAETQAFQRDLEMYWGWSQRPMALPASRSFGAKSLITADGPFPDRCAILLDPPMMEQARRAAASFQAEVVRLGVRTFGQLGRTSSRAAARTRPSPKRLRQRKNKLSGPDAKQVSRRKKAHRRGKLPQLARKSRGAPRNSRRDAREPKGHRKKIPRSPNPPAVKSRKGSKKVPVRVRRQMLRGEIKSLGGNKKPGGTKAVRPKKPARRIQAVTHRKRKPALHATSVMPVVKNAKNRQRRTPFHR